MPYIDAAIQGLFGVICGGVSAAFLALVFMLALSRKLFGILENDGDWNG